jgi:heme-degrading monooxygenase HmoA
MPYVAKTPKPPYYAVWARDPEHQVAKRKGREIWYAHYMIRISKVERVYGKPDA